MMKQIRQGFSLIEVMVALVVVAVSLGAVIHTVGISAHHETFIGEQTFARWVGMNQLAKAKLEHAFPRVGKTKGDDEMAGTKWVWEQNTLSTADENVRRVELSIWRSGHDKEEPAATVVGFLAK